MAVEEWRKLILTTGTPRTVRVLRFQPPSSPRRRLDGYDYTYNSLNDPLEWVYTATDERPCVKARQPIG